MRLLLLATLALAFRAIAEVPADARFVVPSAPYRAPYFPDKDSDVLQQVPAAAEPEVRRMEALRSKLNSEPTNLQLADQLARAYIDFGRELGDARYSGYAEAVIAPWMTIPSPPAVALVLEATILQYRHQFSASRAALSRALKGDPQNTQAWLTLATLDMVQGEYSTAAGDCVQAARTGGFIISMACSGNLRSYVGQAQQSTLMLKQLEGDVPGMSPSLKAWVQGLLAESSERLGNWAQAEDHYRKALSYTPKDNFLLVAYADFLLDRSRPAEVLPLLANCTQSDTAFLRIALAQAALNSRDLPQYTWVMAARFEALTQRGSDYYGREQVRFALYLQHDPSRALALAQRNWQVQRAPWDARVLLEAAKAANQPEAAAPVLAFLQRTRLQDPIIEPLAQELRAQLKNAQSAIP